MNDIRSNSILLSRPGRSACASLLALCLLTAPAFGHSGASSADEGAAPIPMGDAAASPDAAASAAPPPADSGPAGLGDRGRRNLEILAGLGASGATALGLFGLGLLTTHNDALMNSLWVGAVAAPVVVGPAATWGAGRGLGVDGSYKSTLAGGLMGGGIGGAAGFGVGLILGLVSVSGGGSCDKVYDEDGYDDSCEAAPPIGLFVLPPLGALVGGHLGSAIGGARRMEKMAGRAVSWRITPQPIAVGREVAFGLGASGTF